MRGLEFLVQSGGSGALLLELDSSEMARDVVEMARDVMEMARDVMKRRARGVMEMARDVMEMAGGCRGGGGCGDGEGECVMEWDCAVMEVTWR